MAILGNRRSVVQLHDPDIAEAHRVAVPPPSGSAPCPLDSPSPCPRKPSRSRAESPTSHPIPRRFAALPKKERLCQICRRSCGEVPPDRLRFRGCSTSIPNQLDRFEDYCVDRVKLGAGQVVVRLRRDRRHTPRCGHAAAVNRETENAARDLPLTPVSSVIHALPAAEVLCVRGLKRAAPARRRCCAGATTRLIRAVK